MLACRFMLQSGFCAAADIGETYEIVVVYLTAVNMDVRAFKKPIASALYFNMAPMCVAGGPLRPEDHLGAALAVPVPNGDSVEEHVDNFIGQMAHAAAMGSPSAIDTLIAFYHNLGTFEGLGSNYIAKSCAENIHYCDLLSKDDENFCTKAGTVAAVEMLLLGSMTWAQSDKCRVFMLRLCVEVISITGPFAAEIDTAIRAVFEDGAKQ